MFDYLSASSIIFSKRKTQTNKQTKQKQTKTNNPALSKHVTATAVNAICCILKRFLFIHGSLFPLGRQLLISHQILVIADLLLEPCAQVVMTPRIKRPLRVVALPPSFLYFL